MKTEDLKKTKEIIQRILKLMVAGVIIIDIPKNIAYINADKCWLEKDENYKTNFCNSIILYCSIQKAERYNHRKKFKFVPQDNKKIVLASVYRKEVKINL